MGNLVSLFGKLKSVIKQYDATMNIPPSNTN